MTEKPTETDPNALDALHAELPENERATGELIRQSVHSEAAEVPDMPDDLLDEVLGDLGVQQEAVGEVVRGGSALDRFLNVMRSAPLAWGGAAAAACLVAVLAVKMNQSNGSGTGGTRGGGNGTVIVSQEPPLIIVFQPTDELREAVSSNFGGVLFPATQADLDRLVGATDRARVVVTNEISSYAAGEESATTTLLPESTDDVIETIDEIRQRMAPSGQ